MFSLVGKEMVVLCCVVPIPLYCDSWELVLIVPYKFRNVTKIEGEVVKTEPLSFL